MNGIVFPLVAYDADALKRDVNLTVGEAVLFVHTMEKLSAQGGDFTRSAIGGSQDMPEEEIQTAIQAWNNLESKDSVVKNSEKEATGWGTYQQEAALAYSTKQQVIQYGSQMQLFYLFS